jgi:hypothetical protein
MSSIHRALYALAGLAMTGSVVAAGAAFATRATWLPIADAIVAALEEPEFASIHDADAVLAYLATHRDRISLVVLDADGSPLLAHRADEPRVLASTMKVVALSALARALRDDAIPATVSTDDWESWYVPDTDGGAHPTAYDRLGIPHHHGYATEPRSVGWDVVASAMIQESDNAATDLVLHTLGPRVDAETTTLGEPPIRLLMPTFLELHGVQGVDWSDPEARRSAIARRAAAPGLRAQRRVFGERLPRGTALGYANLMRQVAQGTWIDEDTSAFMADVLDWPMEYPDNQQRYETFGAKGGSVAGVLTDTMYLIPREGPNQGEVLAGSLFMNDMSGSAWLAMMGSFAQQGFLVRVMTDDAFRAEVEEALR